MDPVRAAWLKTVLKDAHSQRNNIAFNEVLSTNPEYLATIKTPHDLIPVSYTHLTLPTKRIV